MILECNEPRTKQCMDCMIWTCDLHGASSHESHQTQLLKEGFKAAEVLDVSDDDTDESEQWEDINNDAQENESGDENNNLDTSFQSSISNKSNRLLVSSKSSIKKRRRKSK